MGNCVSGNTAATIAAENARTTESVGGKNMIGAAWFFRDRLVWAIQEAERIHIDNQEAERTQIDNQESERIQIGNQEAERI